MGFTCLHAVNIRGLLAMPLPSINLLLLAETVFSLVLEMIVLLIIGEILSTLVKAGITLSCIVQAVL